MWMNENEIYEAGRQFAEHPVLGPATATLTALMEWTDSNSDGWPYWRKPAQAAAKLMELVQQGIAHEREAYQLPRTPEPTAEQYKAALRSVKAFRTRQENERGPGLRPLFPIYDVLPEGKSGRTFAAELALSEAEELHRDAHQREQAALALRRLAGIELAESRQVDSARTVLAELVREQAALDSHASGPYADERRAELPRIIGLATPGKAVWLLPERTDGKFSGLGHLATSLGMTGPTGRHLVVVKDAEHSAPHNWRRLYPYVVLLPGEAAAKWWVVDGAGNLVTGGHDDRVRMLALAAEQDVPCKVVQGAEFVPGARDVLVASEQCDECQALIPDAEAAEVNAHHWPHCSLHPGSVTAIA